MRWADLKPSTCSVCSKDRSEHPPGELGPLWCPEVQRGRARIFRPVRVNWDLMPLCRMQDHDPGDGDARR